MHDKHILNTNAPIQKNISFLPSIADFFILREYKQRRSDTKKIYQKNNIYFKQQQIGTNIHLNLILHLTMHFQDFSQNTWHVILTWFRKKIKFNLKNISYFVEILFHSRWHYLCLSNITIEFLNLSDMFGVKKLLSAV